MHSVLSTTCGERRRPQTFPGGRQAKSVLLYTKQCETWRATATANYGPKTTNMEIKAYKSTTKIRIERYKAARASPRTRRRRRTPVTNAIRFLYFGNSPQRDRDSSPRHLSTKIRIIACEYDFSLPSGARAHTHTRKYWSSRRLLPTYFFLKIHRCTCICYKTQ